jgi:hypothetical protein
MCGKQERCAKNKKKKTRNISVPVTYTHVAYKWEKPCDWMDWCPYNGVRESIVFEINGNLKLIGKRKATVEKIKKFNVVIELIYVRTGFGSLPVTALSWCLSHLDLPIFMPFCLFDWAQRTNFPQCQAKNKKSEK